MGNIECSWLKDIALKDTIVLMLYVCKKKHSMYYNSPKIDIRFSGFFFSLNDKNLVWQIITTLQISPNLERPRNGMRT